MDPVIRSAQLAPSRTRLTTQPVAGAQAPPLAGVNPRAEDHAVQAEKEQALRAEIEQSLRAQWEQLARDERARARSDGYAAGLAAARQTVDEANQQQRARFEQDTADLLQSLARIHAEAVDRLQDAVGELAFAAVCRLVSQRAGSREFVQLLVEQACAGLRADSRATARLHPRDIELLSDLSVADDPGAPELRVGGLLLTLVADDSLALGGCVLESASGQLDGGLEAQLRRLHAVMARPTEGDMGGAKP